MFDIEIKIIYFLFSFLSIRFWVWLALVLVEKIINFGRNFLGILEVSLLVMVRVLFVLVGFIYNI